MRGWLLIGLIVVATSGCGGGAAKQKAVEENASNLKPLAVLYGRFCQQHRGKGPANEEEFKKFVQAFSADELKTIGATSADDVFVSARDKQPFQIRYGLQMAGAAEVIAWEQTGADGRRMIGNSLGAVEEVDEATFQQRVPQQP